MENLKAGAKGTARVRAVAIFSQPIQQIVTMLVVAGLVAAGGWLIHGQVAEVFLSNLWLNGFIGVIFVLGVLTCFWQVLILMQSVSWIEGFAQNVPGHEITRPPRLLAPLASLLRSRGSSQAHISASS